MDGNQVSFPAHPQGELQERGEDHDLIERGKAVETFGGKVFVRWDAEAAVTHSLRWQQWVEDCPLRYSSPNAPPKADILGTILLGVLAGHKRYAHVTTIRSDGVLPGLLGMKRVRSEDAVRRAFLKGEAAEYAQWLHTHPEHSYEELLKEPWILDMDGTVKPLYGEREQAVRGYNPTKHGQPSPVYQTYFIAAIRMVLDVEVQAGNQTASLYAQPGLWAWLDRRPREQWPNLVRGDIGWGTEAMMVECEKRGLRYLFKIRQTTQAQRHIAGLFGRNDWVPAGGGWQGLSSELQLSGWSRKRRVAVLRRPVREPAATATAAPANGQGELFGSMEVYRNLIVKTG